MIALIVGVVGALLTVTVLVTGADGIARGNGAQVAVAGLLGLLLLTLAVCIPRGARAFGAWRDRHVAAGQASA